MAKSKVLGFGVKVLALYGGYKLAAPFLSEIKEEVTHRMWDTTIPKFKEWMVNGLEKLVFGEVSYKRYPNDDIRKPTIAYTSANYCMLTLEGITFLSASDAILVLANLQEWAQQYGEVSVGDILEMCGMTPKYVDQQYGWKFSAHSCVKLPYQWYIKKIDDTHWKIQFPMVERIS